MTRNWSNNAIREMGLERFVTDLETLYQGNPWYGNSMCDALDKVPLEHWNRKPNGVSNSIAALVFHMIDWRGFVIEKIKGNALFDIPLNSPMDWRVDNEVRNNAERIEALRALEATQTELCALLKQKKEDWLEAKTAGKPYNNAYMLAGMLQHDAYHLGQINLINSILTRTRDE